MVGCEEWERPIGCEELLAAGRCTGLLSELCDVPGSCLIGAALELRLMGCCAGFAADLFAERDRGRESHRERIEEGGEGEGDQAIRRFWISSVALFTVT